jgi:hypothetical protein
LESNRVFGSVPSDDIYAVLSLTCATVADKRWILPSCLKDVGAQFLELLPGLWRGVFGVDMETHFTLASKTVNILMDR